MMMIVIGFIITMIVKSWFNEPSSAKFYAGHELNSGIPEIPEFFFFIKNV